MSVMQVGSLAVIPLPDGHGREVAREVLLRPGFEPDPWTCHLHMLDGEGNLHLPVGGFLLRTGDRVVLIDAGVGTIDNGKYRGGQLLESLVEQGVTPEDVTDVVFTHLHFDHVGWATQQGAVVFANATYRVHQKDWEHFVDGPEVVPGAARKLGPLRERLETFDTDTTIAPGLDARPMTGHTPGSTVYVVSSEGETGLLIGDLAHATVELTEPGWQFAFDHDRDEAMDSRAQLVAEFADSGAVIGGGHFPDFRPGRLETIARELQWTTI